MFKERKIYNIIIFIAVVCLILQNLNFILYTLEDLFSIISPFIAGGAMAFVLKVPLDFIEKGLKKIIKKENFIRPLSIVLTLISVGAVIFAVWTLVIPELLETIVSLTESIGPFLENVVRIISENVDMPYVAEYLSSIDIDWLNIVNKAFEIFNQNMTSFFNTTISATTVIIGVIVNFFLAFIFSIYVLLQKETLARQCAMLINAFFPEKISKNILKISRLSNDVFCKFISGQCLEAVILGAMFFVSMSVFKMPYTLLISVSIGFLALIPIFGAFIGCAIGVFLILINNPSQALFFLVLFFVIQQIEGNLIYPYVVGGSVGLPSIWVLVAVTVGGSLFGVVGMLVFIPLSAVFYITLREITYKKIRVDEVDNEENMEIEEIIEEENC